MWKFILTLLASFLLVGSIQLAPLETTPPETLVAQHHWIPLEDDAPNVPITPTPTATVAIKKPPTELTPLERLWEAVVVWFPEQPEKAYRVFLCENTNADPTLVSDDGLHVGVAQQAWEYWGWPPLDTFAQVEIARSIWRAQGWGRGWPVCGQR